MEKQQKLFKKIWMATAIFLAAITILTWITPDTITLRTSTKGLNIADGPVHVRVRAVSAVNSSEVLYSADKKGVVENGLLTVSWQPNKKMQSQASLVEVCARSGGNLNHKKVTCKAGEYAVSYNIYNRYSCPYYIDPNVTTFFGRLTQRNNVDSSYQIGCQRGGGFAKKSVVEVKSETSSAIDGLALHTDGVLTVQNGALKVVDKDTLKSKSPPNTVVIRELTPVNNVTNTTEVTQTDPAQTLSLSGQVLSISEGNSVTLPSGSGTDSQTLGLAGNNLSISGGNSVDLSGYLDNTDSQALSWDNSTRTLSLVGGGSVVIPDTATPYSAGNGLTLSGSVFSVNSPTCTGTTKLRWSGTAFICAADIDTDTNSGGTVTSITAGTGLTGGTITSSGTIGLSNTGVTAGTYGSATTIPILTINAQGRVTSVTTQAITFPPEQDAVIGNEVVGATGVNSGLVRSGSGTVVSPYTLAVSVGNGIQLSGNQVAINSPACGGTTKLQWTGSAFVCSADVDTDTNTTYSAGTGLSLSGTTFNLANTGIAPGTYNNLTVDAQGRATSGSNVAYLTTEQDAVIGNEITDITGSGLVRTGAGTSLNPYRVGLITSCASGQLLKWNGSSWACSNDIDTDTNTDAQTLALVSNTLSISGGNSVNLSAYLDNTDNQALSWNNGTRTLSLTGGGSVVIPDTNSGGTVTNIATGNGLTGGPITTTGTVAINSPTCAGTDKLQWNGTAFVCSADIDTDTNTTYSSGQGLALSGTTFSLAQQGAVSGQVLKWNGSGWVPSTDIDTDTNTTYTAGNGLALTGTSFAINAPTCVSTDKLQWTGATFICAADVDTDTDTDQQNLSWNSLTTNLSISGGNTVNLASLLDNTDSQNLSLASNNLSISGGNSVDLSAYLDNTDNQTLSWNNGTRTLSLTSGGSVVIPDSDTTYSAGSGIAINGSNVISNTGVLSVSAANTGGNINQPLLVSGTASNPTLGFSNGNTAGEFWQWNGTEWALTTLATGADAIIGNEVVGGTGSNSGLVRSGSGTTIDPYTLAINAGNGLAIASNQLAISSPTCAGTDKLQWTGSAFICSSDVDTDTNTTYSAGQALDLTGTTFSLAQQGATNGQTLKWNGTGWVPANDIDTDTNTTYTAGNGLALTGTSFAVNAPTCAGTDKLQWTGGAFVCSADIDTDTNTDQQNLNWNSLTTDLSISNGNTVNLGSLLDNTDSQTLNLASNNLSISGGNSVDLSAYLDNTDNQTLSWNNGTRTLSLTSGGSVVIPDTDTTYSAGSGLSLTGTNFSVNSPTCAGTDKLQWTGSAFICTSDVDTNSGGTVTSITAQNTGGNVNQPVSIGGTANAPTIGFSNGSLAGQFWQWNGTEWVLATLAAEQDSVVGNEVTGVTGSNSGLTRSGSGTAIDPYTLAINAGNGLAITSGQLAISSPTCAGTDKLQWTGVSFICSTDVDTDTNTTYSAGQALDLTGTTFSLAQQGATNGQTLKWNGTGWVPANDIDTDTNTTYTAGNGLSLTGTSFAVNAPTCAGTTKLQWTGSAFICSTDVDTDTDTDQQSLSWNSLTTDLSISNGNTVNLASLLDNTDSQNLTLASNNLSISGGNSVDLSAYLDNTDNQTLSWNNGTRTLSLTSGGSVVIPDSDTTYTAGSGIAINGSNVISNTGVLSVLVSNIGGNVNQPLLVGGTASNPTVGFSNGSLAGQFWQWNGTEWVLATIAAEQDSVIGNEVVGATGSNSGLVRSGTGTSIDPYTLAINTGNGISIASNQLAISSPTCAGTDKLQWTGTAFVCSTDIDTDTNTTYTAGQALDLTGTTFSLAQQGATNGQTLKWNGTGWVPANDIDTDTNTTYTAGNGLSLTGTSFAVNAPTCAGTDKLQWTGTTFICAADVDTDTDTDQQNLSWNSLTTDLSISGGNTVNLASLLDNTDSQNLSLISNNLSISGGNSVDLSAYLDNTDNQTLSWNNGTRTLSLTSGGSVVIPDTDTTYSAGSGLSLTGTNFSVNSPTCAGTDKLQWTGTAFICATDVDTDTNSGGTVTSVNADTTGGNVNQPISIGGTANDPTIGFSNGSLAGQFWQWNGTEWVLATLAAEQDSVVGNEVVGGTGSNSGLVRSGTGTSIDPYTLAVNAGNGLSIASNQLAISSPTCAGTDKLQWNGTAFICSTDVDTDTDTTYSAGQALDLTGTTFSLAQQGATNGQVLKWNGSGWVPSTDIDTDTTYVAGDGISLTGNSFAIDAPACAGTDKLQWTGTAFVCSADIDTDTDTDTDQQSLSWNSLTTNLSISNGNTVNLASLLDNTDSQTLNLASNTLSISGGNTVDLSGYLDNTDNQTLSWNNGTRTLSLTSGGSVVIPDSDTTYSAGSGISINGSNVISNTGVLGVTAANSGGNVNQPLQVGGTGSNPTVGFSDGSLTGQFWQWNGTEWMLATIAAEQDAVVGNEVIGATAGNSGLVRSGTGTSIDPYTLAVNAGNGLSIASNQLAINAPTCAGTDKLQWTGTTFICSTDVDTNTTYSAGQALDLTGTTFSLAQQGATSGQVLKWNGSGWVPSTDIDTDTNTTYTAGNGLTLAGTTFNINSPTCAGTDKLQWNGTAFVCSADIDTDTDTDQQTLSWNSLTTNLSILGGNTVNLGSLLDNTDSQTLGLAGNNLSISGGNSVDLSGYLDNTDSQTLSWNNGTRTLSLTSGGSVVIPDADTTYSAGNGLSLGGTTFSVNSPTCAGTDKLQWTGSAFVCSSDVDTDTDTTNFNIAAQGTGGSQNIASGNTVTFNNGTGTTATRSGSNISYDLNNTAVTAGTYAPSDNGNGTMAVPQFTVDAQGRLTAASTTNVTLTGITNSQLANSAITVNTAGPLAGGGTVALGGSLNLSLDLSDSGDASTAVTSSGSGLEVSGSNELSLVRGCSNGQLLKWDNTAKTWGCSNDTDTNSGGTVTSVTPATTGGNVNQPIAIGGTANNPTVGFSNGNNAGEFWQWNGSEWVLGTIPTITEQDGVIGNEVVGATAGNSGLVRSGTGTSIDPYTLAVNAGNGLSIAANQLSISSPTCAGTDKLQWNGTAFVCSTDVDTDTDTTYSAGQALDLTGTTFSLAQQGAVPGQVLKWNGSGWVPSTDIDTDTDTTYSAGNGLTLAGTTFSINSPTCGGTDKLQWNGSTFVCSPDVDTDTDTTNFNIAAQGTGGSQNISSGNTVTFNNGTGTTATRSGSSVSYGLNNTSVAAGTYAPTDNGNGSMAIPQFTVDAQGRLTAASTANVTLTGIANSQLANSSITVNTAGPLAGGGSVALGGSINLSLDLSDSADTSTATTTSGSGLEITGTNELSLLRGCSSGQLLKWDNTAKTWGCSNDTDTNSGGTVTSVTAATTGGNANQPITIGGTANAPTVGFSNGASVGQFWQWNGSAWALATLPAEQDAIVGNEVVGVTAGNSGLVRSGSGTSVSPYTLAVNAGNGLSIAANQLGISSPTCAGTDKLQWNGTAFVCSADVDTNTTYSAGQALDLTGTTFSLAQQGAISGQVLKWNGTSWVPANDIDTDTNTTYSAGNGLTLAGTTFSINSPTCGGTDKLQWNGSAFICSADTDTDTTNFNIAAQGTGGSQNISSGNTITFNNGTGTTATRSGNDISYGLNNTSVTSGTYAPNDNGNGSIAVPQFTVDAQGRLTAASTTNVTPTGIANAQLANSAVTINTAGPLTGGGSVSLGGSLNLSLDLSDSSDVSTATTSSGSGLEITGTNELSLLRGCSNSQVLKWDNTAKTWICASDNDTNSGGTVTSVTAATTGGNVNQPITVGGTANAPTVGFANGSTAGEYWQWNGTEWVLATIAAEQDAVIGNEVVGGTGGNSGLVRSGTGTSIDPYTLAVNVGNGLSVTSNQLAINSPTCSGTDKLQWTGSAFVCSPDLGGTAYNAGQGLALTGSTFSLAQQGASSGQVLKWNGAGWVPSTDNDTTYTAGNGIVFSGGTVVNINSPTCSGTTKLQWNGTAFICSADVDTDTDTTNFNIAAQGTGGSQNIASGNTVNFNNGTGTTATRSGSDVTYGLNNTAVSAGTYAPVNNANGSMAIPQFTVDAQGRLTAASTTNVTLTGIANSQLVNSGITINTAGPLAGGGTVALGGSLNLSLDLSDAADASSAIVSSGSGLEISGSSELSLIRGCASGQTLKWDNTAKTWGCASDNNSGGTVTSVATGTGLTGGPITSTGTINIADTGVTFGSYGSQTGTNIPTFTVNAQGQLTVAGSYALSGGGPISVTNGTVGCAGCLTAAVTSLNGLTGATQTFATGATGTDFTISSSGTTHTFNIPDASTTARGLVTTGTQNFAGTKTFDTLVGIGLTTPTSALQIDKGNATASALKFTAGSTTGQTATDGIDFGIDAAGNGEIRQRENTEIRFFTNNTQRLAIDNAGNMLLSAATSSGAGSARKPIIMRQFTGVASGTGNVNTNISSTEYAAASIAGFNVSAGATQGILLGGNITTGQNVQLTITGGTWRVGADILGATNEGTWTINAVFYRTEVSSRNFSTSTTVQ